jgi:hypothetical protein
MRAFDQSPAAKRSWTYDTNSAVFLRITRDVLVLQQIGVGRIAFSDQLTNAKKKLAREAIRL